MTRQILKYAPVRDDRVSPMTSDSSLNNESVPEAAVFEILPKQPVEEPSLPPGVGLSPPQDILAFSEHAVYQMYASAKEQRPDDLEKILRAAQKICQNMQAIYVSPNISELSRISENVLFISLIEEPLKSSLVAHAIKVAALSVYLGQQLHMSSTELHELACCGLVNNIGLLTVPASILTKREALTAEERRILQEHPRRSRDFVSQFGESYQWLANVVHQSHEREDGSGYPQGLVREQIDVRAKIVGLADVYVALIQSRPHRAALKPFEALNKIFSDMEGQFEASLLTILIKALSVYPIGSYVELSSGETARVMVSNPSYPMRPIVEVIADRAGRLVASPQYLNLVENPITYIQKISPSFPQREH